jgi:hypothetical protein
VLHPLVVSEPVREVRLLAFEYSLPFVDGHLR